MKSGRNVAIDDAVRPIPGSTVDPVTNIIIYFGLTDEWACPQIDTSTLAYRKSVVSVSWWINGIRTTVAAEPLRTVSPVDGLWNWGRVLQSAECKNKCDRDFSPRIHIQIPN